MTEKELHKLKRQEVLQLLLVQVQEAEKLQRRLDQAKELLQEEVELCGRLKARLNSKDAQIHKLKGRLDGKDIQIEELKQKLEQLRMERLGELQSTGSIAEACLEVSGIFEAAQRAADLYLENVKQRCVRKEDDRL